MGKTSLPFFKAPGKAKSCHSCSLLIQEEILKSTKVT